MCDRACGDELQLIGVSPPDNRTQPRACFTPQLPHEALEIHGPSADARRINAVKACEGEGTTEGARLDRSSELGVSSAMSMSIAMGMGMCTCR